MRSERTEKKNALRNSKDFVVIFFFFFFSRFLSPKPGRPVPNQNPSLGFFVSSLCSWNRFGPTKPTPARHLEKERKSRRKKFFRKKPNRSVGWRSFFSFFFCSCIIFFFDLVDYWRGRVRVKRRGGGGKYERNKESKEKKEKKSK